LTVLSQMPANLQGLEGICGIGKGEKRRLFMLYFSVAVEIR